MRRRAQLRLLDSFVEASEVVAYQFVANRIVILLAYILASGAVISESNLLSLLDYLNIDLDNREYWELTTKAFAFYTLKAFIFVRDEGLGFVNALEQLALIDGIPDSNSDFSPIIEMAEKMGRSVEQEGD